MRYILQMHPSVFFIKALDFSKFLKDKVEGATIAFKVH